MNGKLKGGTSPHQQTSLSLAEIIRARWTGGPGAQVGGTCLRTEAVPLGQHCPNLQSLAKQRNRSFLPLSPFPAALRTFQLELFQVRRPGVMGLGTKTAVRLDGTERSL